MVSHLACLSGQERFNWRSVYQAQHYDGNIAIPGCDKNMPGCLMAAVRHNRPTIIVYGGTIQAGVRHLDCPAMGYKEGDPVNISDAFESFGKHWAITRVFTSVY